MKSIIATLGTDEFIRVRMGVRPEQIWGDRKDYLLCTMGRDERQIAQQMAVDAADAVEVILTEGVEQGDDAVQPQSVAERGRIRVSEFAVKTARNREDIWKSVSTI